MKIQSKMKALELSQHYKSSFKMLKGSKLHNGDWILTKFNLIQAFIVGIFICKFDEDPFKIESTSIMSLYGFFSDAQGQVTHKSLIRFCQISNPSRIVLVSLLSARMKKIQSKMKALEWSQHYTSVFKMLKGS